MYSEQILKIQELSVHATKQLTTDIGMYYKLNHIKVNSSVGELNSVSDI